MQPMLFLVCLVHLVVNSDAWTFTANYKEIIPGETSNVTLDCRYGPRNGIKYSEVLRIRIYRIPQIDYRYDNVLIADLQANFINTTLDSGLEIIGKKTREGYDSFLKASWPIATNTTPGFYVCEIDGFNTADAHDNYRTPAVTLSILKKTLTSEEVLERLQKAESDFKHKQNALEAEIINLKRKLADYENASIEKQEKFNEDILHLKNFTIDEISKVNNRTDEKIQQADNETAAKIRDIYIHFLGNVSVLNKQDEDTNVKLEREIRERKQQSRDSEARLLQELSDLKNFTIQQIWNQTHNYKLGQLMNTSKDNAEKLKILENDVNDSKKQWQRGNELLARNISELTNNTRDDLMELKNSIDKAIQESMFASKNYTDEEITKLRESIEIIIGDQVSSIQTKVAIAIENKTQTAIVDFQEKLSKWQNETATEIGRQQEANIDIYANFTILRDFMESEYVTKKSMYTELSLAHNFTITEVRKQEDAIFEIKKSTGKEIAAVKQRAYKDIGKIHKIINNLLFNSQMEHEDILSKISGLGTNITSRIEKAIQKTNYDSNNNTSNEIKYLDDKYRNITDTLWNNTCICPTATSAPPVNTQQWPEGNYGFVAPEKGCPYSDEFTWQQGTILFHTASDYNRDIVSVVNHFKKPIIMEIGNDHFVRLHYCLKKDNTPTARQWPKGSYCMNRVNNECPAGFQSVYIAYDGEHEHVQHEHDNAPDIEVVSASIDRVYFCCRNDGQPTDAIALPDTEPFYLYRSNGAECQIVSNMKVSTEIIQIDTSHDDNQDELERPDNRPDVFLNPVNHTMCFYRPYPA